MANTILTKLKNQIIISVQSSFGEPLYNEDVMIAMMKSVISGGARALRLAGPRDIKNAASFDPKIPIIGITKPKVIPENFRELVYITPTVADAKVVVEAGADVVAFDATMRERPNGEKLEDIVNFVKSQGRLAMADIATFEEAENAHKLGCDLISTTLSGYTTESIKSEPQEGPDFELLEKIVRTGANVILEGRIWNPEEVVRAFESGAFAVVVGSAVTRPHEIVKRFIKKGLKTL